MKSDGQAWVRIGWIAGDTVRALLRQRLVVVMAVLTILAVAASRALRVMDFGGAPQRFLLDLGFAAIAWFGAVIAIAGTAHHVHGERESGAAAMVLAKPVRRSEYVVGHWVGVMLLLALFCAAAGALLALLVNLPAAAQERWVVQLTEEPVRAGSVLVGAGVQWLKFGVVVAGVLAISSYARSSTFTILLAATLLTAAYLRAAAQGFYGGGDWLSRGVAAGLGLLPDVQMFEVADQLTGSGAGWEGPHLALLAGYGATYVAGYLALAAWLLRHRDA